MTQPAVIFDIDGTLADIEHRRRLVIFPKEGNYDDNIFRKPDWKAFFDGMQYDAVNEPVAYFARLIWSGCEDAVAVLATGRSECHRQTTVDWLNKNYIPYRALYMRADNDFRPDDIVKREMLGRIRADGYAPFLVVDDRQSVVDMWRSEGLTCLQCAKGDF